MEEQVDSNSPIMFERGSDNKSLDKNTEHIKNQYKTNSQLKTVIKQEVTTGSGTCNPVETLKTLKVTGINQVISTESANMMVSIDYNNHALQTTLASMLERISEGGMNWRCTVCGKTTKGSQTQMKRHVELHLDGVSYPCDQCGKVSRSGNGLHTHMSKHHRN